MTTRVAKTPATVATVTARADAVEISAPGRAPIVLPANLDAEHPARLARSLRGYLADAYVAGRVDATDAMSRLIEAAADVKRGLSA
jgi:hypothetical protein